MDELKFELVDSNKYKLSTQATLDEATFCRRIAGLEVRKITFIEQQETLKNQALEHANNIEKLIEMVEQIQADLDKAYNFLKVNQKEAILRPIIKRITEESMMPPSEPGVNPSEVQTTPSEFKCEVESCEITEPHVHEGKDIVGVTGEEKIDNVPKIKE